jgi:hypothetical protein
LTNRRAAFLASRERCPACGACRIGALDDRDRAVFGCGAAFAISDDTIGVVHPCPVRSARAARHWNQQTEDRTQPETGDRRCTE